MKRVLLTAALAITACSGDPAPRTATPIARAEAPGKLAARPNAPAARCGDGPILFEVISQGVGADTGGYTLYSPSRTLLREGGAFRVEVGAWSHEGCLSVDQERELTRALEAASFTGGSSSCAARPHVDILVRDAKGGREVSYQTFSASLDSPCGPLPDDSVLEIGRLFARMTAKDMPAMPAG